MQPPVLQIVYYREKGFVKYAHCNQHFLPLLLIAAVHRLLGPSSWCTAEGSQLVLELTQAGTLQTGDTLTFKNDQKQLVDKLQAGALFGGSVVVANCLACSSPVANIAGPKVISSSWPCLLSRLCA
jgi:hypothetical protein